MLITRATLPIALSLLARHANLLTHTKTLNANGNEFYKECGATSEYPATHALPKSTALVVRGPQFFRQDFMFVLSIKLKCYRGKC